MKAVRIAELKDRLSRHLREVEGGEEITVLDRDRPIARIVPHRPRRARLTSTRPATAWSDAVRGIAIAPSSRRTDVVALLLEDRAKR